jgi:basic membrane protein A and related proteins
VITRRIASGAAALATAALLVAGLPAAFAQSPSAAAPAGPPLKVVGAYATPIEEPWDGVIDSALKAAAAAGTIDYTFQEDIGYNGDMERVLREIAAESPAVIFGDAFGNADAVRAVAADFPDIAFVFGSDGGPADPNLSVFDNWIQEPAYLAGMLAGGLTTSNIIGVVGAMPIPEVNRLINAYIAGAKSVNDAVDVKVSFIDSFFDPAAAKEAALAQIGAGADVLYAERDGVIEAAQEKGILAIGNMSDQSSLAPDTVVTSVMWDMSPTVQYVLDQVAAGAYTAQDLGYFSSYAKGGAMLAPIAASVPQDLRAKVEAKEADIKSGAFRVDVNEGTPDGSVEAPAASPAG